MNTIDALEKVFAAEVEGRLPFQSKAAIYKRLTEQGLLQIMLLDIKGVIVRGYQLTHAGRYMYCKQCEDEE